MNLDHAEEAVAADLRLRASIDLSDLTSDGDTVELPDGRKLRLRVQPDEGYTINEYESDGRVEWTQNNGYGAVRPDDFNGSARILDRDNHSTLWWEPPRKEIIGTVWDAQTMREEEQRVADLCRWGFSYVSLELLDGKDAYGRAIVRQVEGCGGVDEVYPDLVSELFGELDLTS